MQLRHGELLICARKVLTFIHAFNTTPPHVIVTVCERWCAVNGNVWTKKCKWSQTCDGCPECSGECSTVICKGRHANNQVAWAFSNQWLAGLRWQQLPLLLVFSLTLNMYALTCRCNEKHNRKYFHVQTRKYVELLLFISSLLPITMQFYNQIDLVFNAVLLVLCMHCRFQTVQYDAPRIANSHHLI